MFRTSPTVAGWELMLRIREQSKTLGVRATTIQKELDISSAYWSQVANYRGVLTEEKLSILLGLLEFEPHECEALMKLRAAAKLRGWWHEYSGMFDDVLMRFYGLEDGARVIRSIENLVIPGLLQTEDYIHALVTSVAHTARPTEARQRARARLERQRRLEGTDALELSVVIGQAALMQHVGGPDVQRMQLRHLLEMAEKHPDTLDIRVTPFEARASLASQNAAAFQLLAFESPRLPTLGWIETVLYSAIVDGPKELDSLEYLHRQVQTSALSREESLVLIDRIAGQLE